VRFVPDSRRSSTRQPTGGVNARACRPHSSPARALPSNGVSSHTVRAVESNVNVAVAAAVHPNRAHCLDTDLDTAFARRSIMHRRYLSRAFQRWQSDTRA